MANSLTTEQILLLNNLIYMENNPPFQSLDGNEGKTLAQVVNNIDLNRLDNFREYSTFTTAEEWKDIINAVKADDKLMNTQIASVCDDRNGGMNILFVNPSDNEAIVVYRGTGSPYEWKDNFTGGSSTTQADGVSTAQQENALKWYQSLDLEQYDTVTISGHSKGGNKAKYVTIMDDSVDRCLSFDGQGFSDEFYDVYADKIADNQYKIHNHNVEGDYVNILLNDVGKTTYYKGYNYGDGKFIENHCPNTFLHFYEDGTFTIDKGKQDDSIQKMDEFLNRYLRSISQEEREKTMQMIGEIAQTATSEGGDKVNDILDIILNGENGVYAAELLAFLIVYEQTYPEFAEAIQNILEKMGMADVNRVMDMVFSIINSGHFDWLVDAVDWLGGVIPDWILDILSPMVKDKTGIDLDRSQLQQILSMITNVNQKMPNVNVYMDGADRSVANSGVQYKYFLVQFSALKDAASDMESYGNNISVMFDEVETVMKNLRGISYVTKLPLHVCINRMQKYRSACLSMQINLERIARIYETTEMHIVGG